MRYYYKSKTGKGYLNLEAPLSGSELDNYIQITEEEFNELTAISEPTTEELNKMKLKSRIGSLKNQLRATDYQALKYAEGWLSEEEYASIKATRQSLRNQINELEEQL